MAVDIFVGFRSESGEPIPGGWLIATGFFAVAWLCRRTGRQELRLQHMGFECLRPRVWFFISYCQILLGLNQLLRLETWLTAWGRQIAVAGDWYAQRRPAQVILVGMVCLGGLAVVFSSLYYGRNQWSRYGLAWLGTLTLLGLTAIRAVSFHFIDVALYHRWGIISINRLCELGGIAAVAQGAWKAAWLHLTTDWMTQPAMPRGTVEVGSAAWDQLFSEYHGGTKVKNS